MPSPSGCAPRSRQSFERLRTDVIDLYYLHRVDPELSLERSLEVIGEYHDAGRIRSVGLSSVSVDQILLGRNLVPVTAVQNEYSIGQRRHDDEVEFCTEQGIAFVPFFPLRGGGDAVERSPPATTRTASRSSCAWLLRRSEQMLPIPGTLSLDHAKSNLAALDLELADDEYETLTSASPTRR